MTHQTILHTDTFDVTDVHLNTEAFTHRSFYTQTPWHTVPFYIADAFTHRHFYTQSIYTVHFRAQKLLHTWQLLHTDRNFTRRGFWRHRRFCTQSLLRHRRFYTQMLLHTDPFTSQTLLHSDTFDVTDVHFTCRKGCTPDTSKSQFYRSFWRPTSMSCERVAMDTSKSQFYRSFWRPTSISCERVAMDTSKSQFYRSFWRPTSISCERVAFRGAPATNYNRNFTER